jgi:hypothetical protein
MATESHSDTLYIKSHEGCFPQFLILEERLLDEIALDTGPTKLYQKVKPRIRE